MSDYGTSYLYIATDWVLLVVCGDICPNGNLQKKLIKIGEENNKKRKASAAIFSCGCLFERAMGTIRGIFE